MLALDQILAVTIFLLMFIAIVVGKVHRFIPALIGAALVLIIIFLITLKSPGAVFSALNLEQQCYSYRSLSQYSRDSYC